MRTIFTLLITMLMLATVSFADNLDEVYFQSGVSKYINGDFDGAIDSFKQALDFNKKNENAKLALLKIYLERGLKLYNGKYYQDAMNDFSDAKALSPGNETAVRYYQLCKNNIDDGLGKKQTEGEKVKTLQNELKDDLQKGSAKQVSGAESGKNTESGQAVEQHIFIQSEGNDNSAAFIAALKNTKELMDQKDKTMIGMFHEQRNMLVIFIIVGGLIAIVIVFFLFKFFSHLLQRYQKREEVAMAMEAKMFQMIQEKNPGGTMQLQQAEKMQLLEQKAAVPDEDVDYILQKDKESINRIEEGMKDADPAKKAAAILEMAGIEKERTMAVLEDLLASGKEEDVSLAFTVLGSIADIGSLNLILKNIKEEYFSNNGIRLVLKDSLVNLLEKNNQKLTEKTKNTITTLLNRIGD